MYDSETLAAVRDQLERVAGGEFYGMKFADAGVEPGDVDSWEAFREIPFTTAEELVADFEAPTSRPTRPKGRSTRGRRW